MSMLKEFKEFAMNGSVLDLAIGVIIGSAFGKIISSLVEDVIMPPVGRLLGGVDFGSLFVNLSAGGYKTLAEAKAAGAPTLNYGNFLQAVVDFLIVAFVIFMMVKGINASRRKEAAAPAAPPAPPRQEILLGEIRDLLKAKS
jgi:large conductance mechanosensitive channel